MIEESFLKCSIEDSVAMLSIDLPPLNVLSFLHYQRLCEAIFHLRDTKKVKVIIITGNDRAFISGADINDLSKIRTPAQCEEESLKMKALFRQIEKMKRPVIAAIHGNCFGGGLELAMACHLRLASQKAMLALPEINLGTIPSFGGTHRLPRLVGLPKALELILTGRFISPDEAFRIGLVNEVCPFEDLLPRAKALGFEIAGKGALAIEAAVQAVTGGWELDVDQGMKVESAFSSRLIETHDMKEGITAFFERRKPVFRDE